MTEVYDTKVSIVVPQEMDLWLKEHKEINKSKLFRDAVNKIRYPSRQQLSESLTLNIAILTAVVMSFLLIFMTNFVHFMYIFVIWIFMSATLIAVVASVVVKRRKPNGTIPGQNREV